jgi:hypothetical protein
MQAWQRCFGVPVGTLRCFLVPKGTLTLCSSRCGAVCVQAFRSSRCGILPERTAVHNLRGVSLEGVGRTVLMVLWRIFCLIRREGLGAVCSSMQVAILLLSSSVGCGNLWLRRCVWVPELPATSVYGLQLWRMVGPSTLSWLPCWCAQEEGLGCDCVCGRGNACAWCSQTVWLSMGCGLLCRHPPMHAQCHRSTTNTTTSCSCQCMPGIPDAWLHRLSLSAGTVVLAVLPAWVEAALHEPVSLYELSVRQGWACNVDLHALHQAPT